MTEVKTRTRTCDQCGADLTRAGGAYDWHYVLSGEFTPSTSRIGYDPHPEPPNDRHFCDTECLATWAGHRFDETSVSYEMFDVGASILKTEMQSLPENYDYVAWRRVAIALFQAMWKARPSSVAKAAAKSASAGE